MPTGRAGATSGLYANVTLKLAVTSGNGPLSSLPAGREHRDCVGLLPATPPAPNVERMATREYDLIVWGATGFTGSLMCKHLAQHAPPELRWAVAGRRADALHKLVAELASLPSTRCPPGGVKVADAVAAAADAAGEHADAVRKMVASTHV